MTDADSRVIYTDQPPLVRPLRQRGLSSTLDWVSADMETANRNPCITIRRRVITSNAVGAMTGLSAALTVGEALQDIACRAEPGFEQARRNTMVPDVVLSGSCAVWRADHPDRRNSLRDGNTEDPDCRWIRPRSSSPVSPASMPPGSVCIIGRRRSLAGSARLLAGQCTADGDCGRAPGCHSDRTIGGTTLILP